MLWMRMSVSAGAPAALETYRNALDVLKGFPISDDPFDQHFADLVPNRIIGANQRIAAAIAANEDPDQDDVDLVTAPGAPDEAWGINIADEWPLASNPALSLTPSQMQDLVPFPAGSTLFDFDTSLSEWVRQVIDP